MLTLALLTLTLAAALLAAGLRGRRADGHPVCRRCGYDLTGRSPDTTHCGECGADLTRPKAVQTRGRVRRPGLAWTGVTLGLLAVSVGGTVAGRRLRQVDWIRHEPAGWLLRDADRQRPNQVAALAELTRRLLAGELSSSMTAAVIDHALAVQANRSRPAIGVDWQALVEAGVQSRRIAPAQVRRYVEQSVRTRLVAKPQFPCGRHPAVGTNAWTENLFYPLRVHGTLRLGGLRLDRPDRVLQRLTWKVDDFDSLMPYDNPYDRVSRLDVPLPTNLPPGVGHRLFVDFTFDVTGTEPVDTGPFRFTRRASVDVELVGPDAAVDPVCVDPARRAAEGACVAVEEVAVEGDDSRRGEDDRDVLRLTILTTWPSVPLAADVVVVQGGRESRLGQLRTAPFETRNNLIRGPLPRWLAPGVFDVELRPSRDAADDTPEVRTYWGEPIVLRGVRTPPGPPPRR